MAVDDDGHGDPPDCLLCVEPEGAITPIAATRVLGQGVESGPSDTKLRQTRRPLSFIVLLSFRSPSRIELAVASTTAISGFEGVSQ